jgi:hypothetical protein
MFKTDKRYTHEKSCLGKEAALDALVLKTARLLLRLLATEKNLLPL